MRVSRAKAVYRSGPKKGKLKPGCRFIKGDGADCKSAKQMQRRGKKKAKRQGKKRRKLTGAARYARKGVAPHTPKMDRLNDWRRVFRKGNCNEKKKALRMIKKQFQHMAASPPKPKRGETVGQAAQRRWRRWQAEYVNKLRQAEATCSGRRARKVPLAPFPAMVDGLGRMPRTGSGSRSKKRHPCATANPPAWCNR